ncbi:AN1-type zinc finger protein 1-like, partial [Chrysoperla carnea]|uniref:AN1-type zinc finger protein 1-like n=1 Tax=Chrysoperla carnea TaxID=189513 RepID=UPI001D091A99
MELPNIGQQCSVLDCKQLDFLPLKCSCQKYFCSEHFYLHANQCRLLNSDFKLSSSETKINRCSIDNCKNVHQLLSFECSKCSKYFCIEHRYHNECFNDLNPQISDENQEQKTAGLFKKAQENIDQVINQQLEAAMKKPSVSQTAVKVNLMRLKSRAKGESSIPVTERIYFTINYYLNEQELSIPVYVSNKWSVGRSIDFIAKLCNLKNNNNIKDALKLNLFKKTDSNVELITNCMSDRFDNLIKESIVTNGSTLLIDYCD